MSKDFHFDGFALPTYTQVPDEVFDVLAPELTEAELRVLLYVVRRTFGFRKECDAISVSQMVSGITTKDGQVLDKGTGMSRSAVWRGATGLVKKGILHVERTLSADGDYEANVYRLRFRAAGGVSLQESNPYSLKEQRVSLQESTQQTVEQQTVKQETENSSTRKASTSKKYDQERAVLLAYIQDFARELGDEASVTASTTRAVNLYRQSGLALEDFVEHLYAARQVTKERTAAIKGRPRSEPNGYAPKNKMAYYFAIVEDLVGLRKTAEGG